MTSILYVPIVHCPIQRTDDGEDRIVHGFDIIRIDTVLGKDCLRRRLLMFLLRI